MNVVKVKSEKIKLNDSNPRSITGENFEKLKQSIKEFPTMLELRPIIIDEDFVVLGGNMRMAACNELGIKEVPTIQIKNLTEEQKKEFVIKDNLSFGEWDWDVLANEWDSTLLNDWGLQVWDANNDLYTISNDKPIDDSMSEEEPSASGDKYSAFELIMIHENKLLLIQVLSKIKEEKKLFKMEDALMHLINKYKDEK